MHIVLFVHIALFVHIVLFFAHWTVLSCADLHIVRQTRALVQGR